MSVLIRGMEMPKSCRDCRFIAWKRGVGQHCAVDDRITFRATLDGFDVGYERNGDCPLVHVPPHGRLIDAADLQKDIHEHDYVLVDVWHSIDNGMFTNGIDYAISVSPTIIEAEGE